MMQLVRTMTCSTICEKRKLTSERGGKLLEGRSTITAVVLLGGRAGYLLLFRALTRGAAV